MYAFGMYPRSYYVLVDPNALETDLPKSSYIFLGIALILLIIAIINVIFAKVHEAATGDRFEAILPRQMNYFLWIIPTIALAITALLVSLQYSFTLLNHLQTFLLVPSIINTIIPAVIIYSADQVKHHTAKVFKTIMEEAFLLSIYVIPTILTVIMYCTLYTIYQFFDM